jgi:uncharacterized membrane protein (DUF485 family)
MQSKKQSLIEALTNIFIGYFVALASQMVIFPLFDIHISVSDNIWIGVWFTVISIIRSYVVRRVFNKKAQT